MRNGTKSLRRRPGVQLLEERAVPALLVNEVYCNPPATDDSREYIEIRNTAGAAPLTDVWVLEVEGDGTNAGVIDNAVNLSSFQTGVNGLLMIGHLYGTNNATPWTTLVHADTKLADMNRPGNTTIENGNVTIMLVTGFTGAVATDYDADNDGVIETPPWATVIDAAGWLDGTTPGKIYSPAALTQTSGTSDAMTRFPSNTTAFSAAAWYNGDIIAVGGVPDLGREYDALKAAVNLPPGGIITPGDANFGPAVPPTIAAIQVNDGAAHRSMVTSFKVSFSEAVTFPNGENAAFVLTRTGPTGLTGAVSLTAVQAGNDMTLTVANGGAISLDGKSLVDGLYTLTIVAANVQGAGGQLDGDGNGTGGDDRAFLTHRLFGDFDGDRTVAASDFIQFRLALGGSSTAFDFDGDGSVSAADFIQFRLRFGGSV